MAGERILIVAPSWVGDAILSEPLVALLRDPYEDPIVDVLVHSWCAPVYERMRGIRRIIENPMGHGRFDLAGRRKLARELKGEGYTHALVLPNSLKSALVPYLARIPKRVGYAGEGRYGLLTEARRLDKKALPRLVDRFAALAMPRGGLVVIDKPDRCILRHRSGDDRTGLADGLIDVIVAAGLADRPFEADRRHRPGTDL